MRKTNLRIVSAITSLALLTGTAGVASLASIASAAPPEVTTQAATGITASGATLNATNGDTDATGSAFWVATSSFSVSSSSSPTLPAGVYSTGDLGAVASSSNFSAPLSSATLPSALGVEASTTYYYVAWVDIGGTWYPGAVENFTTLPNAPPATPVLSDITVSNIGTSTATISWNSDIAATGTVSYGTTTSYGSTANSTTTASTTQSVMLTGLQEGTMYHFSVMGANGSATSSASSDMTFVTLSTASSTPLSVTGLDTVRSTATADNSFEDGWKWVMHLTVPDTENAFRIKFSDWNMSSTTSFPANGNIRLSIAQSSNASTTGSSITETGNGYSDWFYLTGDASPSTPGRQVDLTIEVKVPFGTAAGSYTTAYTAQSFPSTATSTAP